jgi:hypothetical protein
MLNAEFPPSFLLPQEYNWSVRLYRALCLKTR